MQELKVLNPGLQDALNPFSEEEMGLVLGGRGCKEQVSCMKGYTATGCNCGYQGPPIRVVADPTN